MCVCVRVCVCVRERFRECVCGRACECMCMREKGESVGVCLCSGVGMCGFGICPQLYSISFMPELLLHSPKSEDLATSRLHLTLAL